MISSTYNKKIGVVEWLYSYTIIERINFPFLLLLNHLQMPIKLYLSYYISYSSVTKYAGISIELDNDLKNSP